MNNVVTSLTLTEFHSGLSSALQTTVGTISGSSTLTGTTGFTISEETEKDLTFNVVSLSGDVEVDDPATITIVALYTQDSVVTELDLDLRWADMPEGSQLAVTSSNGKLNVNRLNVSGTDFFGVSEQDAQAGDMELKIEMWIKEPHALTANSAVTLTLASIESSNGGPAKKETLEKLRIDLG